MERRRGEGPFPPLLLCCKIYSSSEEQAFLHCSLHRFPKGQDCRSFSRFSSTRLLHKQMPLQCLAKCLALTALNKQLVKMILGGRKAPPSPRTESSRYPSAPAFCTHPCTRMGRRGPQHITAQSYKESTLLDIQGQFLFLPLPVTLAGVRTGAVAWYRVEEILLM